jgi:hypothetical protein
MAHYRLFFMRKSSTHIGDCEEFDAKTDADAVEAAKTRRRAVSMEIWCEARKLCAWEKRA